MSEIENKTAFITGGASGIGLGMAQALAAAGAKVVIADVNREGAEHAAASLISAGATACAVTLDVRSPESWTQAADEAESRFGPIHIFCSNAGMGAGRGRVEDRALEDLDWVWEVNARGMFLGVKTLLPRIRQHGMGGHIVITSSVMGLFSTPQISLYAMSKYAATALAETLFLELKESNIGVSLLCPGVVNTALLSNAQQQLPSQQGNAANTETVNLLAAAMPPRAVGDHVVKAIRNDAFYIFTHPEYRALVAERFEMILAAFGDSASPAHRDDLSYFSPTYRG